MVNHFEGSQRFRVLVAGGGVAGLEVTLALASLARGRVAIDLLTPEEEFPYRPLAIPEAFGLEPRLRLALSELVEATGIRLSQDALVSVHADRGMVRTRGGDEFSYDVLVVACGARALIAVPGALTFDNDKGIAAFERMLEDISRGTVRRLAFALPAGAGWPLPLYELALLTAAHLDTVGRIRTELTLVTHEEEPLALLGGAAGDAVRALLEEHGISLITGRHPVAADESGLVLVPDGLVPADRVVSLPRLEGPRIPGLPCDPRGFIPTDTYGQVIGVERVFAAGDVTAFPVKQGGIAARQADAVAETIAARSGAPVTPRPFEPVLRGVLLTGAMPRYFRAALGGGRGETSQASGWPLWWPPTKIAATHLAAFLAERHAASPVPEGAPPSPGLEVEVEVDLDEVAGPV